MTTPYVQLKEASQLTGMNEMTIRRLAKKPESRKYVKREENKILIQQDYLFKHYPPAPIKEIPATELKKDIDDVQKDVQDLYRHPHIQQILAAKDETIKVLKGELESKERILLQVNERSREQNIIIQSLQDKLAKQLPVSTETNLTAEPTKKDTKQIKKSYDTMDYVYIGVAIAALLTLLSFMGLMLFAYFQNKT